VSKVWSDESVSGINITYLKKIWLKLIPNKDKEWDA